MMLFEEIWNSVDGDERQVIQGILQVSVSQFHLSKGNLNGATILLGEGLGRIKTREPFIKAFSYVDYTRPIELAKKCDQIKKKNFGIPFAAKAAPLKLWINVHQLQVEVVVLLQMGFLGLHRLHLYKRGHYQRYLHQVWCFHLRKQKPQLQNRCFCVTVVCSCCKSRKSLQLITINSILISI